MSNRTMTIAVLGLMALLHQACHKSPTAPEQPAPSGGTPVGVSASGKGGNGGGGGGGKGGGETALVAMSGGMVGAAQEVAIQNDNNRELNVQGPYDNQVAMSATHVAGSAACSIDPAGADPSLLFSKLLDGLQNRFRMVMIVDKNGPDHRLTLNFVDDDSALENVVLNVTDGVSVAEGPADTFQLSGGNVRITDRRGKPKDYVKLTCPNLDSITVVLDRGGS